MLYKNKSQNIQWIGCHVRVCLSPVQLEWKPMARGGLSLCPSGSQSLLLFYTQVTDKRKRGRGRHVRGVFVSPPQKERLGQTAWPCLTAGGPEECVPAVRRQEGGPRCDIRLALWLDLFFYKAFLIDFKERERETPMTRD